ncbi:NTP transferase domain-containing protein [Candidatus Gottesmanbacteria bacterium]|nr:NTP transferase domain-containing protein [Candidatus Gottesmanbacteria bacterium]
MKDILCLLLGAGDSSRFWPLSDKHFIPFLGKPLIYHSVSQLFRWGVRNFVIVVNNDNKPNFQIVKSAFPQASISLVSQTEKKGMAGAVLSAKSLIAGKEVLVVGPSDVFEDSLPSQLTKLRASHPDGIITGMTLENYFPGGYLKVKEGNVTGIVEKPKPTELPSNIITFVFDYFKDGGMLAEALEKVEENRDDSFEQGLDWMVKNGRVVKFLHYKGFFGYLKYPWHVLNISAYYLDKVTERKDKGVTIDMSSVISGKVYLGEGVRVLENAKIVGPTYIGRGTVIGNNVLIRQSLIGENCVIGNGSEITRSHIGNNCWFHTNYVGDSVIANNVSMGSGTVLANFRLDEGSIKSKIAGQLMDSGKVKLGAIIGENVRIGVNASIMPGIKIGKGSFVGAGVVLDRDLSDNKYCCKAESSYLIKDNRIDISNKTRQSLRKELRI